MLSDFFILLKHELLLTVILFLFLFLKLGSKAWNTNSLLTFINTALFINLIAGLFFNTEGKLFGDMFFTNNLLVLEKKYTEPRYFYNFVASIQLVKNP